VIIAICYTPPDHSRFGAQKTFALAPFSLRRAENLCTAPEKLARGTLYEFEGAFQIVVHYSARRKSLRPRRSLFGAQKTFAPAPFGLTLTNGGE
jgi:hypothetical protein